MGFSCKPSKARSLLQGGVGEWERSVHYACILTFDGPCSSVSKTKAGPDGHLMCTAIYCQSGRGKQRAAVLLQLLLQRSAFMEITCVKRWKEGGGAAEKACVYNCIIAFVCSATPLTRSSAVSEIVPWWAAFKTRVLPTVGSKTKRSDCVTVPAVPDNTAHQEI